MSWFCITKSPILREKIMPEVDDILDLKGEFLSSKKKGLGWGLLSLKENFSWKITPSYTDVGSFSQGLLPCKKGEMWGFVDEQDQEVLPFLWNYVHPFSYGVSVVSKEDKWGMINKKGEWLIAPSADFLRSYSDEYSLGRVRETWFFLNLQGKSVLRPHYSFIHSFHGGMAAVNIGGTLLQNKIVMGGEWGFINKQGIIVIRPSYSWVGHFYSLYAPYYKENKDEWGLLSKSGKEIPFAGVSGIRDFTEGLATVEKDGLWGFANIQGEFLIEPIYTQLKPFVQGRAFGKKEELV